MSLNPPIRVLLVEDNPGDALLVRVMLEDGARTAFQVAEVDRLSRAADLLAANGFDIALVDLSLPDSRGIHTVEAIRALAPQLPLVVLTGLDDEQTALSAMQAGAQDYLVKGQGDADAMRRTVRYALERGRAEAALRESEARFRAIFEGTSAGIALTDDQGRLLTVNSALSVMLRCEETDLLGRDILDFALPEDAQKQRAAIADMLAGHRFHVHVETRFRRRNGLILWGGVGISRVQSAAGEPVRFIHIIEDITGRKGLEEQMRLSAKVLENTREGIFVTDAKGAIILVNPAFSQLTGFDAAEVLGQNPRLLSSGRQDRAFYERMWDSLTHSGQWQGEIWNRRKSGEVYAEWLTVSAVQDDRGQVSHYVAVFSDITLRKEAEERLNFLATHDALTGLPNRSLFSERLTQALARARRGHNLLAVLFLDLDGFKRINDTYGHEVGDALLQAVAGRLSGRIRQTDTVARLGGDEFIILIEDALSVRDAAVVAQSLLDCLTPPIRIRDLALSISTSLGISLYSRDGTDGDTLVRHADEAMYRAKKAGRNTYQFYAAAAHLQAEERLALEREMARALAGDAFALDYQAQVEAASGRIIGVEALLRWKHPEKGLLTPPEFLEVAEESGLILPIGEWVIRTACHQAQDWARRGAPPFTLGVNLSALQLHQPDLVSIVAEALKESGLDPARLELEVSERDLARGDETIPRTLRALKGLGARIAIDDFGTGASSFSYIKQFPVDTLKVDISMVRERPAPPGNGQAPGSGQAPGGGPVQGGGQEGARLLDAIIGMAGALNLQVVAEAVETRAQLDFLTRHGCTLAQGFFLGRPMPATDFAKTLLPAPALPVPTPTFD